MAFGVDMTHPSSPRLSSTTTLDDYDSSSTTDSDTTYTRANHSFIPLTSSSSNPPRSGFLLPSTPSGHSSASSTATSTPFPSRSTSPLPQFYLSSISNPSSSCTSDTDSDPSLLLRTNRNLWRENRRSWWSTSRRRRKRNGRIVRFLKKWTRRIVRHPFFPSQPITIVSTILSIRFNP